MQNPLFRKVALEKAASPDQLDQLIEVTSPAGWLGLLAVGGMLFAALVWSVLARVELSVPGRGVLDTDDGDPGRLAAVLYVSLDNGARVRPGMTVNLSPVGVRKEEYGLLRGTVVAMSTRPATQQELLHVLGNDALAQALAAAGDLLEVRVRLNIAPQMPDGYQWTSAHGPPFALQRGTLCSGTIVISEQSPISLVVQSR